MKNSHQAENTIKIDPELKKLINNFFSTASCTKDEDDQIIYHYTTWEGLKGILETQELRFSNYRFTNDTSEVSYAVGFFGENIFIENENERHAFYEDQKNALQYFPFFIASMCIRKDYLPAWRFYGNDGSGFAIGFNRGKMIRNGWYKYVESKPAFEGISHDVQYVDRKEISDIEREKFSQLRFYYERIKNDVIKKREFLMAVRSLFPLVKHKCYQEEGEVRMAFSNLSYSGNQECPVYFRHSGKNSFCNSIPYIVKPIEIDWIEEIWTGPRVTHEHANQEIKGLLENKCNGLIGHEVKIWNSFLPYKNSAYL